MCMYCRSLFVCLYIFFRPLCCLFFFDLRILITPFGIFKLFLLAHWNNRPRIDMSPNSDTLSWFRVKFWLFLLNAACLTEKKPIPILSLSQTTIYCTRDEHTKNYTTVNRNIYLLTMKHNIFNNYKIEKMPQNLIIYSYEFIRNELKKNVLYLFGYVLTVSPIFFKNVITVHKMLLLYIICYHCT